MLKSAIVVLAVLFGTAISATAFDSNSYITAEAKKVTLIRLLFVIALAVNE